MSKFHLHLTLLAQTYDRLRSTPPFDRWNLPEPEDVLFKVGHTPLLRGEYSRTTDGRHVIMISDATIGSLHWLDMTMAHEMIHLYQGNVGMETAASHNKAFQKLADRVSSIHTWDRKIF